VSENFFILGALILLLGSPLALISAALGGFDPQVERAVGGDRLIPPSVRQQ
jgi:hypothetical protein